MVAVGIGYSGDLSTGRDAAQLVSPGLGEPDRPIRPTPDKGLVGKAALRRWDRILGDRPVQGDPADPVSVGLRKPDRTIRTEDEAARCTVGQGQGILGDRYGGASGRDTGRVRDNGRGRRHYHGKQCKGGAQQQAKY